MKPELLHDVRLVERNVSRGRLTQAELDQYLKDLPDAGPNAANLEESLAERNVLPEPPAANKAQAPRKAGK